MKLMATLNNDDVMEAIREWGEKRGYKFTGKPKLEASFSTPGNYNTSLGYRVEFEGSQESTPHAPTPPRTPGDSGLLLELGDEKPRG